LEGWYAANSIIQHDPNMLACVGFGTVDCSQNVRFPGHRGRLEKFIQGETVQTKGSGKVWIAADCNKASNLCSYRRNNYCLSSDTHFERIWRYFKFWDTLLKRNT